tara:strand:+ start:937 stop:1143 length:207 start_codon:yes stop_codon:yes gene_type:complete
MEAEPPICLFKVRAQMLSSQEKIEELARLWASVATDSTTPDQALLEKKAQILSIDERKNEIVRLWKLL